MTQTIKLNDSFLTKIVTEAFDAAKAATDAYLAKGLHFYPCGFAWVNIKPARGQLVSFLKKRKIGRTDDYYGGYTIWNPSENPTQEMEAKIAGARAFADVLRKYGFNATAYSRMD